MGTKITQLDAEATVASIPSGREEGVRLRDRLALARAEENAVALRAAVDAAYDVLRVEGIVAKARLALDKSLNRRSH